MVVASFAILLLGNLSISMLSSLPFNSLSWKMVVGYLKGQKATSLSCFLALALSSLLINLIPQLETTLLTEIQRPEGEKLPSLFVFDIQEGQEGEVIATAEKYGHPINYMSPMIRARLTHHNGESVSKGNAENGFSRESERAQRSRNRGVNLSYRSSLQDSKRL